jgi:protein-tyrosine phosphatase
MKRILFLCTGNYYRSRFAEQLFNALAERQGLDWRAESRGLAVERGILNIGAISRDVVRGLAARGIAPPAGERFPLQATAADLASAGKIIALDEAEHRPLIAERFPAWAAAVEYWHIHDLNQAAAPEGLAQIEEKVQELIGRLRAHPTSSLPPRGGEREEAGGKGEVREEVSLPTARTP